MGLRNNWVVRWCRRRIYDPLVIIIRRGTEPKQLAFSTALGITLGVFPVYGMTALLCGVAALLLRSHCHAPTLMLANLVATPLELSLIIPFLRLAERISGGQHLEITSKALQGALSGHFPHELLVGLLYAILGWAIAVPFILCFLYICFLPLFRYLNRRLKTEPPTRQQFATRTTSFKLGVV